MNDLLAFIFGMGKDLEWWQMASRAFLFFFVTIGLIRLSGRRSFSMGSSFDQVITILLGAIMSRAITGASPMLGTCTSCLVLVSLHRFIAWFCIHHPVADRLFKGKPIVLYEHGKIIQENLDRSLIGKTDLEQEVRTVGNAGSFTEIEKATLERNGKISITKKELGAQ